MLLLSMPRPPNASPQTHRLLAAMLERPQSWRYGYELSKETGLQSGTLYPLLMRLSDQELLESRWQEPERVGRPARHAYRLTVQGRQFARDIDSSLAARRTRRRPGEVPA
jgi:PadR family transcriptional regulator, regulatory protein PadR